MPLYLCRWTNGDCSFVFASSKGEAIELLDEIGNAVGCPLTPIHDFMVYARGSHDSAKRRNQGLAVGRPRLDRALPIM
jgi:hypothetical protein